MKKIAIIILAVNLIYSCGNNESPANTSSTEKKDLAKSSKSIIGSWHPIGLDVNLEGKTTPSGNWKYTDKKDSANIKEAVLSYNEGDLTFKADGTGYMGNEEPKDGDDFFKWKTLDGGRYCLDVGEESNTNVANVEIFYIDDKGQLIHHTSVKQVLMGKEVMQNSFELYKRK